MGARKVDGGLGGFLIQEQIDLILDCVPTLRGQERFVTPLRGGIANRNYLVDTGQKSFVLRVGSDNTELLGIDRSVEYACSLAAAELGVGTEVVDFLPEFGSLILGFARGRVLRPIDVQEPAVLARVVEALRRYHDGPAGAGTFSPFSVVRDYYALAWNRQVAFPPVIGEAMQRLAHVEAALTTDEAPCPCHNDLFSSSLVDDGSTVRMIDWEYGGMGDRMFDLGNLAANNAFDESHEQMLLELYFGEIRPEHLQKLHLMRLTSDLRESMWRFLQSSISGLDYEFLHYGRAYLDRFLQGSEAMGIGPFSCEQYATTAGTLVRPL
jgi:thiamine kinase-like enzyme